MQEIRPGSTISEFPGGSFNEMQRRIRRLEAQLLPRLRGGRGGGGGTASIIGTVAVTLDDVPEPSEVTEEMLPEDVAEHLPESYSQPIYKLGQSTTADYLLVIHYPETGDPEVYAIPPHSEQAGVPIYNTAGEVGSGSLVQCKRVRTADGTEVRLVDVEKCAS